MSRAAGARRGLGCVRRTAAVVAGSLALVGAFGASGGDAASAGHRDATGAVLRGATWRPAHGVTAPTLRRAASPSLDGVTDATLRSVAQASSPSIALVDYKVTAQMINDTAGIIYTIQLEASGTGFFVSSDGYFVTATHVATPDDSDLLTQMVLVYLDQKDNCNGATDSQCAQREQQQLPATLPLFRLSSRDEHVHVLTQDGTIKDAGHPAAVVAHSATAKLDVAVLKVDGVGPAPVVVVDPAVEATGTFAFVGYPASNFSRSDPIVPVVVEGKRDGVGAGDVGIAASAQTIAVDAPLEHGDSGGPGFGADGRVVGILSYTSGGNRFYMVSSRDVLSVLSTTPARNELGQIDTLWRTGLDAMRRNQERHAHDLFAQCARLNGVQVGCADQASRLQATIQVNPPSPDLKLGLGMRRFLPVQAIVPPVAATLVALLVIVAILQAVRFRRERRLVRAWRPPYAWGEATAVHPSSHWWSHEHWWEVQHYWHRVAAHHAAAAAAMGTSTAAPVVATPAPPVATPGPSVVTPGPPVATPGPSVATPGPPLATPGPPVAAPGPSVATPGPVVAPVAAPAPAEPSPPPAWPRPPG